ncbi:MAG: polyprenyl synthetase family protein, partial [Alphaproteobacteria bacterium]
MALVVDLHAGRDKGRQPSLDLLTALVADDLARVNELVLKKMESQVALIPELAGHIIAAGGKRLRPMLVLGAAR